MGFPNVNDLIAANFPTASDYWVYNEGSLIKIKYYKDGRKTFIWARKSKKMGWIVSDDNSLDNVGLYKYQTLKDAEEVFITEGEKDADSLIKLGLVAVSSPASSYWSKEYNKQLAGKKVYLLGDNDKAGEKFIESLVLELSLSVKSLFHIDLPYSEPGEDITDWLENNFSFEDTDLANSDIETIEGAIEELLAYAEPISKRILRARQYFKSPEELLDKLENVQKTGKNKYLASCPLPEHGKGDGDRNPSLAISFKEDNRILVRCFSCCIGKPAKTYYKRLLKELGLSNYILRLKDPEAEKIAAEDKLDMMLNPKTFNDAGNAFIVSELNPDTVAYNDSFGWLIYTGKFWERENAKYKVRTLAKETLAERGKLAFQLEDTEKQKRLLAKSVLSRNNINNTVELLKDVSIVPSDRFDKEKDVLNCLSGVIDLKTGELITHSPNDYFSYCIPTEYKPTPSDSPLWLDQLSQTVEDGSAELIDFFQLCLGYAITGISREEKAFFLEGETRSGKGTIQNTLLTILGKPLAEGMNFETIVDSQRQDAQNFGLAGLYASRLVFTSEMNRQEKLNAAKLKNITGNDPIRCSFKNKDQFSYIPMFKIWMLSNFPPNVDPEDDAAWNRLIHFRFPNSFEDTPDKYRKENLLAPDSREFILHWLVEGSKRWFNDSKGLVTPKKLINNREEAREQVDYIKQFVEDTLTLPEPDLKGDLYDLGYFAPSTELYNLYKEFCLENGFTHKNQGNFVRSMVKRYGCRRISRRIDGKVTRLILGVQSTKLPL